MVHSNDISGMGNGLDTLLLWSPMKLTTRITIFVLNKTRMEVAHMAVSNHGNRV